LIQLVNNNEAGGDGLVFQKPKQSNRQVRLWRSAGSGKSVACVKRNTKDLGGPDGFPARAVGEADQKKVSRGIWESDQLIVLSERETVYRGKGLT